MTIPTDKERLRFAMVTTFYPPYNFGGDGLAVRRLVHALAGRGHQVDVIHDADAFRVLSNGPEPEPLEEPEGVRVHRLETRLGAISCLLTQQLGRPAVHGRQIRRILGRGFDVIHFHNVSLVGGPGILSYGSGVKIYTAHEHWLVCPTHVLWRHNREICDGRECFRCVLRHRRPPQLWRSGNLLARSAEHVDAFTTLSQFSADKHKEFGFPHEFTVIPPFLSDSDGSGTDWADMPSSERPFFLFAGRLEPIKGLQDVIPLFDRTMPADLWIAGSGTMEAELRQLARNSPQVRFLGHRTSPQLRALYKAARGVVLPSKCFEVFPTVVLEAFREGTPIVARRLGPFPEIVASSGGGLLFDDQTELRAALGRIAREDTLRNRLGANGRSAYETSWNEGVAMKRYFGLICQIAADRGDAARILSGLSDVDSVPVA